MERQKKVDQPETMINNSTSCLEMSQFLLKLQINKMEITTHNTTNTKIPHSLRQ